MVLGWGLGLGGLGYLLLDIYGSIFQRSVDLQSFIDAFPEEFLAFFGDTNSFLTMEGFLGLEFFSYMPVILGILVVSSASSLISKQEENGSLELIAAQPISRSEIFWGKVFALIISVFLILLMTWTGMFLAVSRAENLDLSALELINPFISLFAILLVFLGFALFLAMILQSGGSAGLLAGFLLIASYFITSLSRLDEDLAPFNRFSPMKYYQGGDAIKALDVEYLLILLGISVVFFVLAWLFFAKRDFRFGGSGGIRLNLFKKAK
jgi:ABC-2 type transport system permease protein